MMLKNLFSTDYGLMSLAVILVTLGIGWYLARWVGRKMDEDEKRSG
jgi:hypothetical protein